MTLPRILIIKTGSTVSTLRATDGDYDDWFRAGLEQGNERVDVHPAKKPLPDPRGWGGVILTGSPASVRDEAPWMRKLGEWALQAAEAGVPVLGVCFGHQLLGEVLGGRVEATPDGAEYGTTEVRLTDAGLGDPLFAGLPPTLAVQQTHGDAIVLPPLPDRATLLATNDACTWQAFAAGPLVRGVQFHPELRAETLQRLLDLRGRGGAVRESPHGARILRNWDERFVGRG